MRFADVRLVIGTRPEAIKLAPVAHALAARGIAPRLFLTGQHPELDVSAYGLQDFDRIELRCRGLPDPRDHALAVAARLADSLLDPPDVLLVQGDTSSALGGAMAGKAMSVAVGHVEAGLRTHDRSSPWPEEEFRVTIDKIAHLLFAPTGISAANLRAENVEGQIHVTGNTAIDAALSAATNVAAVRTDGRARLLVTCHRRESWGDGLRSIAAALIELAANADIDLVLHPNPRVAATMKTSLGQCRGIRLLLPCSHREMLELMMSATLTLSDSGGMQEEASALGAPLLVLRDKTERPEAIGTGNMVLVGTDAVRIVAETRRLLSDPDALARMRLPAFPYGDGKSAPRIASIVADWLVQQKGARSLPKTRPSSMLLGRLKTDS